MIDYDIDRIQSSRVYAVTRKYPGSDRTLQRCEAKEIIAVSAKNKLDETVAESTDAIVEEDGMGHGCHQRNLSILEARIGLIRQEMWRTANDTQSTGMTASASSKIFLRTKRSARASICGSCANRQ